MPKPENPMWGWRPEPEEGKEFNLHYAKPEAGRSFAREMSIPKMPEVLNQGGKGACTAFGTIGALRTARLQKGLPAGPLSELGLYYDSRASEGTVMEDAGAIIKDVIKIINKVGVAPESVWPYIEDNFAVKPPPEYYAAAEKDKVKIYASVDNSNENNIKLALSHNVPVVFGMKVFKSFMSYTNGVLQMPKWLEQFLGGHCMFIHASSDSRGAFGVRNSWGADWGESGDVWIPYEYICKTSLATDFWAIRAS